MNIDEILNMIDDMLEEAWSLPFSGGRCVVDAQKVKECIEDIRLNLPGEIKQAKMIVADRNDIIKSAERQGWSTSISTSASHLIAVVLIHSPLFHIKQKAAF